MAKLYFYYASMNAGKSTTLLQADFNYRERGMETMLYTDRLDDRVAHGVIASRIGLQIGGNLYDSATDIRAEVEEELKKRQLHCILLDEAQFLTRAQVVQLASICDELDIPVLAYGLRTDFQANLFEGSAHLLALADTFVELKAVCDCGRKATMNLRVDADGRAVKEGASIEIGGNDRYISLCRRHFMDRIAEVDGEQLRLSLTARRRQAGVEPARTRPISGSYGEVSDGQPAFHRLRFDRRRPRRGAARAAAAGPGAGNTWLCPREGRQLTGSAAAAKPRPMHGWIAIDKPVGPGSTKIVAAVKRALREGGYPKVKVGHGGTLDPLASGVLPIAFGEATKLGGRMLTRTRFMSSPSGPARRRIRWTRKGGGRDAPTGVRAWPRSRRCCRASKPWSCAR